LTRASLIRLSFVKNMLFGDKRLYEQARAIKKGLSRLDPCLESVRSRLSEKLGIKILSLVYDTIDIGPAKGRPRLNLIIETLDDFNRIHENQFTIMQDVKETTLKEFTEIVGHMGKQSQFETRNVLLISDAFADEAMNQAAFKFTEKNTYSIIKAFPNEKLWKITGFGRHIVVFFVDENAKSLALANGATDRIRSACFERMKVYDEFNYLTLENLSVCFDTKENLDKNYQGNFYYYFK
jgi:hypothetical protein